MGAVFVEQMRKKGAGVPEETLTEIQKISAWLGEARAPAFHLERVYAETDARRALTRQSSSSLRSGGRSERLTSGGGTACASW